MHPNMLETRGSTCVVALSDDSLLHGLTEIRTRLAGMAYSGGADLVLDLSRLDRLSSATLAAMLWARRTCYARGGRVVVRHPNRRCREVLTRTGVAGLFVIRPERSERSVGRARLHADAASAR